jgi:hypothetical protein
VVGGWLATSGFGQGVAVTAWTLGAAPSSAAMAVTLSAGLVFAMALLWAFAARSVWRAWGGLVAVYGTGLALAEGVPPLLNWLAEGMA